jgi:hypothetical protein
LTWYKDLEPLAASSRCHTDHNPSSGIALLKMTTTLPTDLGDYLILAESALGRDMTSCNLSLDLEPTVDTASMVAAEALECLERGALRTAARLMPPRVVIPLSGVRIEQGTSFRMACKIDGVPKPKVQRLTSGCSVISGGKESS